jgi:hypothetical protein
MSTKKIREAIRALSAIAPDGSILHTLYLDALEETQAIERAARAIHEDMDPRVMSHAPASIHAALDTLTDIAKATR